MSSMSAPQSLPPPAADSPPAVPPTPPQGLSQADVQQRLTQFGPNELLERKVNPLLKFLSYFWGPIPWMIEAAIILSAVVGDWADFAIILVLLLGNGLIGFWEEHSASNAVDALKAQLASNAMVKRDGQWQSIAARELVPGDKIRIKIGDVVPADVQLQTEDPVQVDQAALTGESLPVSRGQGEDLYSGSVLKRGQAEAVVTGTGTNTFFGRTAKLVAQTETTSHFQQAVLKIGDFLIIGALALVCVILVVRVLAGDDFVQLLKFCLVLTVASIPVAMPTVLSVTMAAGAQKLAQKDAVVTHLAAIEELAGLDLLCSDKTGTLTLNQLTLGDPFTLPGTTAQDLTLAAALASQLEDPDPIDQTIFKGLPDQGPLNDYECLHFTPFDPVSKRTEADIRDRAGRTFKVSKGAPQVILDLVADQAQVEAQANQAITDFAQKGYRALGVARTDDQGTWHLLGILSMFDPPRPDSQVTLQNLNRLGVPVKMVTGDQVLIARETCHQLRLGQNIMDAAVMRATPASQLGHLGDDIEAADGFGQVFPEDKYHIIETLQSRGHIVGMTGDGVNDAPALKRADAGIAVSGATDAARAAADIVLLDSGLSVIEDAVRLSRQIFERMKSYTLYRIIETIRVLVFITLSILVFGSYPLTAIMIVLLALLNDGALISIAYDRTKTADTPQNWNMGLILGIASVLGAVCVAETFILYALALDVFKLSTAQVQTLVYLNLAVAGMMTLYSTRTRGPFWSTKPSRTLMLATGAAVLISTVMSAVGIFVPAIGWAWTAASWGYAFVWLLILDAIKLLIYPIFDHEVVLGKGHVSRWQRLRKLKL
jgi:H+-transporting ATPase